MRPLFFSLAMALTPGLALAQDVPAPPSSPLADRVPVQAIRGMVVVRCPATLGDDRTGFALADRRTVIASQTMWRCRRPLVVIDHHGGHHEVARVLRPDGTGLMRVELAGPLPPDAAPLSLSSADSSLREGQRLYALEHVFERIPFRVRIGHVLQTHPELEFRLDEGYVACPPGSPLLDTYGHVVGVCDGDGVSDAEEVRALEASDEPTEAPMIDVSGGGGYGLALFVQGDGTFGLGGETNFELTLFDEWSIAASWGLFGFDFNPAGDARWLRVQHELRLGYRLFLGSDGMFGGALEISLGAAVGVDLPMVSGAGESEDLFVRPTARIRLVYGVWQIGYAVYFDLEQPSDATVHQLVLGATFEP